MSHEAREVLLQMPSRQPGKSRLDSILYELDAGIRNRIDSWDTDTLEKQII